MNVTAIVPVYNGSRYLGAALASVHEQTVPVAEVIVVDDGSTDGSYELAESLGARCLRQDHAGIGAARNLGVRHARGELLGFLDADDLWAPDKLEVQLRVLDRSSEVDAVLGYVQQFVSPDLSPAERASLTCPDEPQPPGVAGAMLIRRPAFERTGGFGEEWRVAEFLDWYARAVDLGVRFETVPDVVLRRRLHRSNTTRERSDERGVYLDVLKAALDRRRATA